jgi:hypothetical protein
MPDPAASALAVERPNIFAAPASHPRHQPRRGGIFDDTARAESTHEAQRSSRSGATPRLRYLAPAVLAIVAAVSLLAVTQERTARTEAEKAPPHRDLPNIRTPSPAASEKAAPQRVRHRRDQRARRRDRGRAATRRKRPEAPTALRRSAPPAAAPVATATPRPQPVIPPAARPAVPAPRPAAVPTAAPPEFM